MTACEYSGRPPDTNSQQPSLRPEQRTARSELATRENTMITRNPIWLCTRENDFGTQNQLSAGPPPPGVAPPEIVCFFNQTDFTATRVPGGPEAGRALAFRRPSVTNIYL